MPCPGRGVIALGEGTAIDRHAIGQCLQAEKIARIGEAHGRVTEGSTVEVTHDAVAVLDVRVPVEHVQPAAPETPASHPVTRVTRPLPLAPAGIADFIDEMIAQENTEGGGPGARRRAS